MQRDTFTRLVVLIVAVAGCTALLWALTGFSDADDAPEPTPRPKIGPWINGIFNTPTPVIVPFQRTYIPQSEPYQPSGYEVPSLWPTVDRTQQRMDELERDMERRLQRQQDEFEMELQRQERRLKERQDCLLEPKRYVFETC